MEGELAMNQKLKSLTEYWKILAMFVVLLILYKNPDLPSFYQTLLYIPLGVMFYPWLASC